MRAWGPSTGSTACALAGRRCSLWGWWRGVPGGGIFHRCEGRLKSGAPPPPTARLLGGLCGSVTHMLWARACGCGGPSLPLWPACRVGAACRGGGGGPSPGGWPATVARGVRCQALSLPLPPILWGGRPGSRDPCVPGAVGAGVGTQHQPHSVRPCGPALLAVGVAERRPRGGCLPPLRGTSEVRRPPSPDCPPTGRAVGVRHPRAVGVGVWVWGPNTVPLACTPDGGCVPRGWWGAVPGGGWPATVVRGVWCQALPLPRLPAHWAGCWGLPPTCCGRGCVGVGAQHCPFALHALWGLRAVGVVGGRPRGGWPATVMRGVWCQALSLPQPPVLWSGQPGLRDPCVPGSVDAGVGTQHRPHSERPCGPALLAVGRAEGRPRGGCLPPL